MTDIHVITGEALDQEAAIVIADVLAAHSAWSEDAPARYRHLLDAKAIVKSYYATLAR